LLTSRQYPSNSRLIVFAILTLLYLEGSSIFLPAEGSECLPRSRLGLLHVFGAWAVARRVTHFCREHKQGSRNQQSVPLAEQLRKPCSR
jgi:hypothetical protein